VSSPQAEDSDKPEAKKIGADPESIDALLVGLFPVAQEEQAPDRIILELDATDSDTLYGNQEGRFYHGRYHHCRYLPLNVSCGAHPLCSRLGMSNIHAAADSMEELDPVAAHIRQLWPARWRRRSYFGFHPER